MERISFGDPRCNVIDAEFWGTFPEEPRQQQQHSTTLTLYRNKEGEWFRVRRDKGPAPRRQFPQGTSDIAPIHAEILSPHETSKFLDDVLWALLNELESD